MGVQGNRRGRWGRVALVVALVSFGLVSVASDVEAADEVRLTAAGDYGARASTVTVLDKIAELAPDAHLALGDLAYGDSADEYAWCNFVKARLGEGFPFQLISGNHESEDVKDGEINNFSACLPNQVPGVQGVYGREYTMDFPERTPLVRVIQAAPHLTFLDGKWTYAQGDAHHAWLSAAIDEGRAKGAKWIVVSSHLPCQSVGQYSCSMPKDFYDLLLAKKVDLVLHGHEHLYQRTHQLRSGVSGCATLPVNSYNPACVADNDGTFVAGAGTVFATVGTGGIPLRSVNTSDSEAGYFGAWSGLDTNPAYGLLDLRFTEDRITAEFVATSGTFSDAFSVVRGLVPPNQPPTASFSSSIADLAVDVDGSGSTDPDGTIASHSWTFGDGTTATGAVPGRHTYATAGTYDVTLVVTDDRGATSSVTRSVTVTDPVTVVTLASDTFGRTLATGWGSANTGGSWSVSTSSAFSTTGSVGVLTSPAGVGRAAYLRSVSSSSTDLSMTISSDKVPAGGGQYVSFVPRAVPSVGEYQGVFRFRSDGRIGLRLARQTGSTSTTLAPEIALAGLTYAAGDQFRIRVQATGVQPTTLRAKVWRVGSAEPTTWALSVVDSTAALQANGGIGINTHLSGTAVNAPVATSFDDLIAVRP
jgi:PKD repeat protein